MNKLALFCFTVSILTFTFQAAELPATGLDEVIRLAMKNDARLRADIYKAAAQKAQGWGSVAVYGPTLSLSSTYTRSRDTTEPTFIPETWEGKDPENRAVNFLEPQFHVGFEQPLIDLEKARLVSRGRFEIRAAELQKKKAREELLLKVYRYYYEILSTREKLYLARRETEALKQQTDTVREKLALGFGVITDRYDAESRYQLSRAAEIDRSDDLENAKRALEEIINASLPEELDDPGNSESPVPPHDLEYWRSFGRKHNTDIQLKKIEVEIAREKHQAVRGRFLPSLVFFAEYNERRPDHGISGYGETRTEADVGIRLKMSILSGGRDSAAVAESSAELKAAREQAVAAIRSFNRSLDSLWYGLETTRELIAVYSQAVDSSRNSLESTRAAYKEGEKVLLDVLNSQRDFFKTLTNLRSRQYNYLVIYEKFKILTGSEKRILPAR